MVSDTFQSGPGLAALCVIAVFAGGLVALVSINLARYYFQQWRAAKAEDQAFRNRIRNYVEKL